MPQPPAPAEQNGHLVVHIARWLTPKRTQVFRWSVAVLIVLFALLARFALDPFLPPENPFPTFFLAVVLASFVAGTGPAVLTTVVGALLALYFFVPPAHSLVPDRGYMALLFLFLLVCGTVIALVHIMRCSLILLTNAEARAQDYARERDQFACERDLMFKELQHRVSNNLSVVASLLALQRREVGDPVARQALDEAQARLEVVSRLSRLLHDPNMQRVDLRAFLRSMVPDAMAASGADRRIEVRVEADDVTIDARRAVPVGLIATELLVNAVEHGFPNEAAGRIELHLERQGRSYAQLTVRHNGSGLPHDFDLSKVSSLGLTVAKQFAQQLGAELRILEDRGVASCLTFPIVDPKVG